MNELLSAETYEPSACVVFLKTHDTWGRLSNMAGEMPLRIGGVTVRTSEHLFQALRFPGHSDIQQAVLGQASPMMVKRIARKNDYDAMVRSDWELVHIELMRWCIRVKLAQHPNQFGQELMRTGNRSIVERAARATGALSYWAARATANGTLYGMNVMGKLLVELREEVQTKGLEAMKVVQPPTGVELVLLGQPISTMISRATAAAVHSREFD